MVGEGPKARKVGGGIRVTPPVPASALVASEVICDDRKEKKVLNTKHSFPHAIVWQSRF
jgi:hypothetical protein